MGREHSRPHATWEILALVVIGVGIVAPAQACDAPEPFTLRVEHDRFGNIGWHALEFACESGALVVETEGHIEVKILLATAYRRDAEWREVWRGDQLIEFEGTMVDNGATYEVSAQLEDGRMIIEGASGRIEAPPGTVPDHPWNEKVIDRPLLFDVRDGYLLEVEAEAVGEEMIVAEGREILAQKYVVKGDLERELWYDEDGRWLQWRLERAGGTITLIREPG